MKLVVNREWGGFATPENLGCNCSRPCSWKHPRDCSALVSYAEANPNGPLQVVEIPDGSFYVISDYDGQETVYFSKSEIHSV